MTHVDSETDNALFNPFAGPAIVSSVPSTEAQREIWFASQYGEDASRAFNEAVTLRFQGALNAPALERAVQALVARHESLRATFSDDGLTMVVTEAPNEPLAHIDLSQAGSPHTELRALETAAVEDVFDLRTGPLVRFLLITIGADEYVLLISAHHIVVDGWSFGVMAADLATLYRRETGAEIGSFDAAPPQFSDYVRHLDSEESTEATNAAQAYWVRQFERHVPVLDLPADAARGSMRTYRSARYDYLLPRDLVQAAGAAGRSQGASLFAVMLTAYAALLNRLTGEDDVVVGVPAAGQPAAGMEGLVGHLVSMLPMRIEIDGESPVRDVLARVRTTVLDSYEQQALTFGALLQQLPMSRDLSRPPLIATAFNLDRRIDPSSIVFGASVSTTFAAVARTCETFELSITAVQEDAGITLECQYNSDLFDASTVAQWMQVYERILRGIAAPERAASTIGSIPLIEGSTTATEGYGEIAEIPEWAPNVGTLIERQAHETPDAVAAEFDGVEMTYRELNARCNKVARALRAQGVRRGSLVGVCVERTLDMFVGVVGVLKSGGAYVPLDPAYPMDRLNFMAEDIQMNVLVTERSVQRDVPLTAPHVLYLDDKASWEGFDSSDLPVDEHSSGREDPAYVIYTSGSTGKPNGVLVPHGAALSLLMAVRRRPGIRPDDRMLAIATLSFDITICEVLLPLTVGARVVLATRETAADGARLRALIESRGVTYIGATPATYRLLFDAGWQGGAHLRVVSAGEAMPPDLAQRLCECLPEVWNGYGPTETTVYATFWRAQLPLTRILIGSAVGNARLYVLDDHMRPVPPGIRGHLFIGGKGVAIGYLNRDELTRARFLPDPFSNEPGARMYRSGDVVRMLADGSLEYFGRSDNQVKLRGFRVELGEIENALGDLDGVRQVAVVVRERRAGDRRLVAFLVPEGQDPLDESELRARLKQRLPDYMVPTLFVHLREMPLTASGKIDRKSLPPVDFAQASAAESFVAPRSKSEELLASLWQETLGIAQVSVRDDFFALGGHSLLASQILARLRRDHGVTLLFRSFFEAPTIERFAPLLDAALETATPADARGIPRRVGEGPAPVSAIQKRVLLLEELQPSQRTTHNVPAAWRLRGPLNHDALRAAIDDFIARHDAVRTEFHEEGGVWTQHVLPRIQLDIAVIDLSTVPVDKQQDAITAHMHADQERPMDVTRAPLLRAVLLKMGAEDHVLFTMRHALIWDGWSFDIFVRELAVSYEARCKGTVATFAPLPIQYADFAAWQKEWLAGPEAGAQVDWWREHLAGDLPVLDFPTDRSRETLSDLSGDRTYITFTSEEVEALRRFSHEQDTTLYMVLFAAYNALLYRYSGQNDVIVGTPARARTWVETEDVVGPFANVLAIRTQMDGRESFAHLLKHVRDTTLGALGRADIPFEMIGAKPPVLRALFSMQDARMRPVATERLAIEQVPEPQRFAANDLILWTMESSVGLRAVLNYSTHLFDTQTAERLLGCMRRLVLEVVKNPDLAIDAIPLTSEADEQARLAAATELSSAHCDAVATLQSTASTSPDAVLAISDDTPVTARELHEKVERLAARLAGTGVQGGQFVAVAVSHAMPRLVALLAIRRIGGVVAIVDPADGAAYNASVIRGTSCAVAVVGTSARCSIISEAVESALVLDERGVLKPEGPEGSVAPYSARSDDRALLSYVPRQDGGAPHVLSHGDMSLRTGGAAARIELRSGRVLVPALGASSDAATALWMGVGVGATVMLGHDDDMTDAEAFVDLLAENPTALVLAPLLVWKAALALGWSPRAARGLTAVVFGRPASGVDVHDLLGEHTKVYSLITAADSTGWLSTSPISTSGAPASFGKPLPARTMTVTDHEGRPAPFGAWGLLNAGSTVASTAPTPEGAHARLNNDGSFAYREGSVRTAFLEGVVDPAEIEALLLQHASVAETTVHVVADSTGQQRLVAWVVESRQGAVVETELRAALKEQLPRHAVPSVIVLINAIPRSSNGSVDSSLLASPYVSSASVQEREPSSGMERALGEIWAELLEVDRVAVTDNFFALGGYSLLCFKVIERLRHDTGAVIGPRILLLGTLEQAAAEAEQSLRR